MLFPPEQSERPDTRERAQPVGTSVLCPARTAGPGANLGAFSTRRVGKRIKKSTKLRLYFHRRHGVEIFSFVGLSAASENGRRFRRRSSFLLLRRRLRRRGLTDLQAQPQCWRDLYFTEWLRGSRAFAWWFDAGTKRMPCILLLDCREFIWMFRWGFNLPN